MAAHTNASESDILAPLQSASNVDCPTAPAPNILAHAELIKRDKFAFIHICHLALLENEILGSTNAIRISPKIIESIESVE